MSWTGYIYNIIILCMVNFSEYKHHEEREKQRKKENAKKKRSFAFQRNWDVGIKIVNNST